MPPGDCGIWVSPGWRGMGTTPVWCWEELWGHPAPPAGLPSSGDQGTAGSATQAPTAPGRGSAAGDRGQGGHSRGCRACRALGAWGQSWFAQGVAVPRSAPLARGRAGGSAGKGCIHGIRSWLRAPGAAGAPETLSSSGGLVGGGSVAFVDVEGPIV